MGRESATNDPFVVNGSVLRFAKSPSIQYSISDAEIVLLSFMNEWFTTLLNTPRVSLYRTLKVCKPLVKDCIGRESATEDPFVMNGSVLRFTKSPSIQYSISDAEMDVFLFKKTLLTTAL